MRKYETPDMEIIHFQTEDIILTSGSGSGPDQGGGEIGGGDGWGE